jgi:aminodeoxyfutalosine deaminase
MQKLACEWLFTGTELLRGQVLTLNENGQVQDIGTSTAGITQDLPGLTTPAFVNAHCHLELSHLKGQIPMHTGMAGFVRRVQPLRDKFTDAEKHHAMEAALLQMRAEGIAAIGDICNGTSSLPLKKDHPEFQYHNFIELFGLNPTQAEEIFFRGLELLKEFGRNTSITPHAPYSMSVALRDKLLGYAHRREWPQSIHLLESQEERQLFAELEGPLMDFIRDIGAVFQAHTYASPVDFIKEALPRNCNVLLVHNTEVTPGELNHLALDWPRTWFVLCPTANKYIHDRLPHAPTFATHLDRICLGTDSLAGNHRLSILAEMQTLQDAFDLSPALLLRWATRNGAAALNMDLQRFQICPGSQPILIHLPEFSGEAPRFPSRATIQFLETCS